jgi:hypothetical protein
VLAELLSLWLAGHWIPGEVEETREVREEMLGMHVEMVRKLVEVNAKILGTDE